MLPGAYLCSREPNFVKLLVQGKSFDSTRGLSMIGYKLFVDDSAGF